MKDSCSLPFFKEIPHKADAAIIAYGNSLPDLFLHSALGMYHIMGITTTKNINKKENLFLKESDSESLLVAFLTELLFLSEIGIKANLVDITFEKNSIKAIYFQIPIAKISREIKAVTFSRMHIKNCEGYLQTEIVFDI